MNPFKNRTDNYKGSSEHLKKKFNVHKIVNLRMQIFIGICVILASILVYRMYYIQFVNADHYHALYEKYQTPDDKYSTKRGDMVDRNYREMVYSKGLNNIVYVPQQGMKDSDIWDTAARFADAFDNEFKLTERESKDLWMRLNPVHVYFSAEESKEHSKHGLKTSEIDRLKRERIDEKMLEQLSDIDKETFKVYLLMNNKEVNNTAVIHEDASVEDIAYLAEHQAEFKGFSSQTAWERDYSENNGLASIFGRIGSPTVEKAPYYLALNYGLNDIVGISGLEYQYEDLLKGKKSVYSKDSVYAEPVQKFEGSPGYDLRLAIDFEMQEKLEKEIITILEASRQDPRRRDSNQMHAVISDPNTGDILAMAAMVRAEDGTYYNDPQRVMLDSNVVGSVVKPITVYMGLSEGAIRPGQVFMDRPLYIQGTPPRKSWKDLGAVDDIRAIQHSSNIYMFYTTIALAGSKYVPNGPLIFEDLNGTVLKMRNYYSQFGLGVETGIDYPNETVGYKGSNTNAGLALEFSIGQYDNYTAMQLNQYVSTLANGGYRLRPRLVIEVGDLKSDRVIYENPVEILNTIENKDHLERVREGMRRCSFYKNCNGFTTANVTSAGKTGTAQTHSNGAAQANHNFISFAPYEEPQVAMSCVHPNAYLDTGSGLRNQCAVLSKIMVESYFK